MGNTATVTTKLRAPRKWRQWFKRLRSTKVDRSLIGPTTSVLLLLFTLVSAITYFQLEERERGKHDLVRATEYTQQSLQLALLETQDEIMRMARDIGARQMKNDSFRFRSEAILIDYPALQSLSWLNAQGEIVATHFSYSVEQENWRSVGSQLQPGTPLKSFNQAKEMGQSVYALQRSAKANKYTLMLFVPVYVRHQFQGALLSEIDLESLLRYGVPRDVMSKFNLTLQDNQGSTVAGSPLHTGAKRFHFLPWSQGLLTYDVELLPISQGLTLHSTGFNTEKSKLGNAFVWVLAALGIFTLRMLVVNIRQARNRQKTQLALEKETNFRRAMENSMLTGMRALDMTGKIIYVNPAFCSMTGWTEEELVGVSAPYPFWPDAERPAFLARVSDEHHWRKAPATGSEVPIKRRNGSIFYARTYVSPLIDPDGKQTGWMTSITDITEPKRIREELTAAHIRFSTVLDSMDAAISVAPLGSTELLFANKTYRDWFARSNHSHRELLDRASALPIPSVSDGDEQVDGLAGLPTDTLIDAKARNTELFLADLGKWVEMRTRYLTWVDGRVVQMVIATDITARRNAEEQAARHTERAEAASRLITMGEMASSVAHELNQPLTAINNYCHGMLSRLSKDNLSPTDLQGALEKTARQAQRAGQIIQRIRAFVKRSEPNPTLSDVLTMVQNATELAEIDLRRLHIRLNTQVATRLPKLMVDPILIEQVLINLIKNAGESILQAQRTDGEGHIDVMVNPKQHDEIDMIEFCVRDNGTGIPAGILEHIYEAFYSTKTEGMGIGLKLCRSIIESHHGRLQARNLYNDDVLVGCEFSFWIPIPTGSPT